MTSQNSGHRLTGLTLNERGQYALDSGLWSNCTFLVGKEREVIRARKSFLAIASPVFQSAIDVDLTQSEPVVIPDLEPGVFKKLLRFTYCHSTDFDSFDEVFQVYSVANVYMIPELCQYCINYLKTALVSSDLLVLYKTMNFAVRFNIEVLKEAVLQEIRYNAEKLLQSSDVQNISASFLNAVFNQEGLRVTSEIIVIDAAMQWANACCRDNDMEVTKANARCFLNRGELFQHIRFLTLTQRELQDVTHTSGILTMDEVILLSQYKWARNFILPEPFCLITEKRTEDFVKVDVLRKQNDGALETNFDLPNNVGTISVTVTIPIDKHDNKTQCTCTEFVNVFLESDDAGEVKIEHKIIENGLPYRRKCFLRGQMNKKCFKTSVQWKKLRTLKCMARKAVHFDDTDIKVKFECIKHVV